MFGVTGLDRSGRPLAAEVVDRYVGGRPDRLAGGVVLPFAAALLEYETTPQELALDVASGAVDLGLEAEVLRDRERRAAVEAHGPGARPVGARPDRREPDRPARAARRHRRRRQAVDRRPARRDRASASGRRRRSPWRPPASTSSRSASRPSASSPTGSTTKASTSRSGGLDRPPAAARRRPRSTAEPAPAGSQRGLAELRQAVDAAAAERRAYARLATVGAAAGRARAGRRRRVRADRHRRRRRRRRDRRRQRRPRSGAGRPRLRPSPPRPIRARPSLVGPGPLVVAPDLARGVPSDATTRAGRALALQLVGVFLARLHGVPPGRLLVGALPPWLLDERGPAAAAIAQVAVRRAVLPDHPLAFEEPAAGTHAAIGWPSILGAALPVAGHAGLDPPVGPRRRRRPRRSPRPAPQRPWPPEAAGSLGPLRPRGPALTMARGDGRRRGRHARAGRRQRLAVDPRRADRGRPPRPARGGCGRRADRGVRPARGHGNGSRG